MTSGILFVTSSQIINFVPEGTSNKEDMLTSSYHCLWDGMLSETIAIPLLARVLAYYKQHYYKQAYFLFSLGSEKKLFQMETLLAIYDQILAQNLKERSQLLLSFVDCFSVFVSYIYERN